jgi:hypothetical protein
MRKSAKKGRLVALAGELHARTGGRGPLWRYAVRLVELYLAVNQATGARKAALQAELRTHEAAGVKRGYVAEHLA